MLRINIVEVYQRRVCCCQYELLCKMNILEIRVDFKYTELFSISYIT